MNVENIHVSAFPNEFFKILLEFVRLAALQQTKNIQLTIRGRIEHSQKYAFFLLSF